MTRNYFFTLLKLVFALTISPLITIKIALADPDVYFSVLTEGVGVDDGPYTSYTQTASWNDNDTITNLALSVTATWEGSASVSGNVGTLTGGVSLEYSGSLNGIGIARTISGLDQYYRAYVRAGKTAQITVTHSADAEANISQEWGSISGSYNGSDVDNYSGTNAALLFTNGGSGTDSGSGGGSYINHGSCGASPTSYRAISGGRSYADGDAQDDFIGTMSSSEQLQFVVTIGIEEPVAQIEGPKVSGVVTPNPALGSALTFTNTSYDPDDGSTALQLICQAAWVLDEPDGTQSFGSTLGSFSKTVTKPGQYTLSLTVTDNEGDTDNTSIGFTVGPERECKPKGSINIGACSDEKSSVGVDPFCGEVSATSHDPVPTRGYPLKNEIKIKSRATDFSIRQPMGNGYFTYGIQLALIDTGSGPSDLNRYLVDGYGNVFDYGLQSSGSAAVTPGVYPTLTEDMTGFTLAGAGSPEEINSAGNFSYEFDLDGKLLKIIDHNGNEHELTYSGDDPILVTDNSSGKTIEFDYNGGGLIDKVTENGGAVYRELTYDAGKITEIETKNSLDVVIRTLSITYDLSGKIHEIVRDNDVDTKATISFQAGGHGHYFGNISYPNGSTNFSYFVAPPGGTAFRTNVSNDKGGTVSYDYNSDGDLIAVREPTHNGAASMNARTFTYDADDNLLTQTIGSSTWTYTYDSLGLITEVEDPLSRSIAFTYDGVNLIEVEDDLGTIYSFAYDNVSFPNVVTEFTDGASNTWTIAHNGFGQITSITPPAGSPTGAMTYTYEENGASPNYGWLKTITNGAGDELTIDDYTSLGDPTSITTSPRSGVYRTVQFAYDALQRPTIKTNPDSTTVQLDYTGADLTSVTDEGGTLYQYSYCAECGKLTGASGPMSWALSWTLDDDWDVTKFTDARSKETDYQYGTAGEMKKTIYPDSTELEYKYDTSGRFKTLVNGRAASLSRTYNAADDVTVFNGFTYTYNSGGQVTKIAHSQSEVNYTYTSNRLVATAAIEADNGLSTTQTIEYAYNDDQTLDTMTWKNGGSTVASWSYGYDGAGRVTSITNSFGETTDFIYDGEGRLLTQENQNGTSREYVYNDDRGWPTLITHKQGVTVVSEYELEYDEGADTVGNLTQVDELSGAVVTYDYDDLYRLIEEDRTGTPSYSRTWDYDLAGNPTDVNGSTFATFDDANKFITVSSNNVTHDNDGNITAIASSPYLFSSFTWSNMSNATRVNKTAGGYVDYRYLNDGKRYYSKPSTGSGVTRFYIYSGDVLIGEISGSPIGPKVAYTWGPDGLISKRDISGSASYWYEFGPQGETRALRNSGGTVTDSYYYNAYGTNISSSGSTENPYRYGGKYGYYTEITTGLILAKQRWYSPDLMRWVSRDPIGYDGGVNLYEYVKSNPVNFHDITGNLPVRNDTGKPLPYKPEKENNKIKICLPGEICDVDGIFPPGRRPSKIRDTCLSKPIPSVGPDCKLTGRCLPFFSEDPLDRDFFEEHRDWPNPYTGENGWPKGMPLLR